MNREIRFRCKRIDNGKWAHGDLSFTKVRGKVFIDYASPFNLSSIPYEVDADTVGQYTGLKDKNGKEIYEGDLVCLYSAFWQEEPELCEVRWVCEKARFEYICSDGVHFILPQDVFEIEVIGNIHDNPEMMK